MEDEGYYVLYCCKKCHKQFREKNDLSEHNALCSSLERQAEKTNETETDPTCHDEENQNQDTQLRHEITSSDKPSGTRSKTSADSACKFLCVEKSPKQQRNKRLTKETSTEVETNDPKRNGRNRREIRQTPRFREYMLNHNYPATDTEENVERKHPRNGKQGLFIESESHRTEREEDNTTNDLQRRNKTYKESAAEIEEDNISSETPDGTPDHSSNVIIIKAIGTDRATLDVKKDRKRKSSAAEENKQAKSKKSPDIPVTLEECPESYSIEEYVSSHPADKGKPALEKLCKRYFCKLCNAYRTISKDQMESHITLHLNNRLNCEQCGMVFNSVHNLSSHMRQEHSHTAVFICEHCGDDFTEKRLYNKHVSRVHKHASYKCPSCEKQFLTNKDYRQHRLDEHDNLAFKCDKCDSIFVVEKMLERHKKNNICERKSFTCEESGCKKKSKALLDDHKRKIHSKEHLFKCNFCTYSAKQNYLLKQHMRAHFGIHPHKCDLCKFSCVKKWQLVSHLRTHTGEKAYKCEKCNYAAAWNVQLKSHMKAHESVTKETCKLCNIVFKDKKSLSTHIFKQHERSVSATTGVSVYRSRFKQQNMLPITGTNLVVYNGKGTPTNQEDGTSLISNASNLMNNLNDVGDKHRNLVANKVRKSSSQKFVALINTDNMDKDKASHFAGPNVSVEMIPQKHYLNILNDLESVTDISQSASDTANNEVDTSVISPIDSFANSREQKSLSKRKETRISEIAINIAERVEMDAHNTDMVQYNKAIGDTFTASLGSESTEVSVSTIATVSESQAKHLPVDNLKSTSKTLLPKSKVSKSLDSNQNKGVKLIRMIVKPDGTQDFELIDQELFNLVTSTNVQTNSLIHNRTEDAHNYAVPIHKRSRLFANSIDLSNHNSDCDRTSNIPDGKQQNVPALELSENNETYVHQ